jgi:hypothetical protein
MMSVLSCGFWPKGGGFPGTACSGRARGVSAASRPGGGFGYGFVVSESWLVVRLGMGAVADFGELSRVERVAHLPADD